MQSLYMPHTNTQKTKREKQEVAIKTVLAEWGGGGWNQIPKKHRLLFSTYLINFPKVILPLAKANEQIKIKVLEPSFKKIAWNLPDTAHR